MTRDPIRPDGALREDLDAHGMSAAELAQRIEVPVNRMTEFLNGRRAVTGHTALRLGRFFGTSGELWLNLQKLFELRRAEQKKAPRSLVCLHSRMATSYRVRVEAHLCLNWNNRLSSVRSTNPVNRL